jgi:hypothetical protein
MIADVPAAGVIKSDDKLVEHLRTRKLTTGLSIRLYVVAIVLGGLLFIFGLLVGVNTASINFNPGQEPLSIAQCIRQTLELIDLKRAPAEPDLRQLFEHCFAVVKSQELINDILVRKVGFIQQYHTNAILMWMVVLITISGVMLAAFQLFGSYQLAMIQKTDFAAAGELALKRDQIVLRSSITGLFILLISFAFFLVFVLYVYRLDAVPKGDFVNAPVVLSPEDGLGPAPGAATGKSK